MKKSIKVRVLCLIVATVILSGAVATAAVMGSPYDTLKRALLDALTYRNVTEEIYTGISVNGVPTEESKAYNILGNDSSISYVFDSDGNNTGYFYRSDAFNVYPEFFVWQDDDTNTQWFSAEVNSYSRYHPYSGGELAVFSQEDRNSARMRFIEMLADALVGDLKNNVTMTSENGIRYVQGTLTGSQIPELAKAGLDVLAEQSNGRYYGDTRYVSFDGEEYVFEQISLSRGVKTVTTCKQYVRPMTSDEQEAWNNGTFYERAANVYWRVTNIGGKDYLVTEEDTIVDEYSVPATRADYSYTSNPLDLPMESIVIDYVHGEAEIDADGNLRYIDVSGTASVTSIFGDVSVMDIKLTARFSDIGTSSPSCPIPGAADIFTPEYMKANFGNENMSVYFMLNEDGSINTSSITTTYPGEIQYNQSISYSYDRPVVTADYPPMFLVPPPIVVSEAAENGGGSDGAGETDGVGGTNVVIHTTRVNDASGAGETDVIGDAGGSGDSAAGAAGIGDNTAGADVAGNNEG